MSETLILLLFAALMLGVAIRMGLKARSTPAESSVVRARFADQARGDPGTVCRYSGDGRLRLNSPCSAALVGGMFAGRGLARYLAGATLQQYKVRIMYIMLNYKIRTML